jgi:hypothetical protein
MNVLIRHHSGDRLRRLGMSGLFRWVRHSDSVQRGVVERLIECELLRIVSDADGAYTEITAAGLQALPRSLRPLMNEHSMNPPTPDTASPPETLVVAGYVCVDPEGAPHWPSAAATIEASLRACFGPADPKRLNRLTEQGWRCIPIEGGPAAPIRKALAEADKQAESGLCCFGREGMHSALKAVRRAASDAGVQGGLTEVAPRKAG